MRISEALFASEQTAGDIVQGENPMIRSAALEALGGREGTVVVINPANGRILAMVNQKLALSSGAEPCSTIKLTVALAALSDGIVTEDTPVALGPHDRMTLTEALAHSNNLYFATLGQRLGFERVSHYAHLFGLGQLAGYDIAGEHPGIYPDTVLPKRFGGIGRMCSFGRSISITPLQLGSLVSAIANGGTLYYLQHPETAEQIASFTPRIKRRLDIAPLISQLTAGMAGAVNYGTARSLRINFKEFPVFGKTGTCSGDGSHLGWFASYADTPTGRIVAVFFLKSHQRTSGPKAADLAGLFYRNLEEHSYFVAQEDHASIRPPAGM